MSDNPYESPNVENIPAQFRLPLSTIGWVALGVVALLILVALFLPMVRIAPQAARRAQCTNNLKQIVIGIRGYEEAYRALPPAYTVDAEGIRLHSWRTLILPFIGESELYEKIDLSRPWNDPANADAANAVVWAYWCPSATHAEGMTTYLGVVGPDFAFSGPISRQMSEIIDGPEATLLVVDVASDQAVHWMSPYDAT